MANLDLTEPLTQWFDTFQDVQQMVLHILKHSIEIRMEQQTSVKKIYRALLIYPHCSIRSCSRLNISSTDHNSETQNLFCLLKH